MNQWHGPIYATAEGKVIGRIRPTLDKTYYAASLNRELGEYLDEAKAKAAVEAFYGEKAVA